MPNQILVPSLGESITEATVSKWFKRVGESVDSDEPLVELETDKVNIEVPSPLSGTLSSIKEKAGAIVEVGALLGIVKNGQSSSTATTKEESTNKKNKKTKSKKQIPLQLVDTTEEESEKEKPLILDNLADSETEDTDASIENEVEKTWSPKNIAYSIRSSTS